MITSILDGPRARRPLLTLLLLSTITLAPLAGGCGDNEPREPETSESGGSLEVGTPAYGVYNLLKASGNKVDVKGSVKQSFFAPTGRVLSVNDAEVQLFEFPSREAAEAAATSISPDGSTIGGKPATLNGTPHFYKTDRVIVLYVGSDATTLQRLGMALGGQFAGGA